MDTALLLARLDQIGASLDRSGHALALLGLGSVGVETDRVDEWSDLDFFAVVEPGHAQAYIDDLSWLTSIAPVAFSFRNTGDGHKLLYADGVFCEFAVFEPATLAAIPFTRGRPVWVREGVDLTTLEPVNAPPADAPVDVAWQVGEALTCLFVGLGRFWRGERFAAARLVQGAAVDRVLALAAAIEPAGAAHRDPFAPERRTEQRFPVTGAHLAGMVQGYDRTPESARAILGFLDGRVPLDPAMLAAVVERCDPPAW